MLLILGIFLWMVVLNKGVLKISAQPKGTYSVTITGGQTKIPIQKNCDLDPCSISLPIGNYNISLKKDGYLEEQASALIQRGKASDLSINFIYIPHVQELDSLASLDFSENSDPDNKLFQFKIDATYNKQQLIYTEPSSQKQVVWAYFDRPLQNPLVFPNPQYTEALVIDRAEEDEIIYLIDGVNFRRSYLGTIKELKSVLWDKINSDNNQILLETGANQNTFWLLDIKTSQITKWPIVTDFQKIIWDKDKTLIFATKQDLPKINGDQKQTSLDALETLLSGQFNDFSTQFFIGQYTPKDGTYRVLYQAPSSLEINYENTSLKYSEIENRLFFTDGVKFYEVTTQGY